MTLSGHVNRVHVLDRFLIYARSKPGVRFARKDEIADFVLQTRGTTPVIRPDPPTETGLPGRAA